MTRGNNEGGPVVLVVEDEVDIREPLAFRLQYAGFTVREAGDGHEAYEILAQRGIDAVLSDVRMPKCDGITLLKRMRTVLGLQIPFAFVTADGRQHVHDLLQARSQAVFAKPFDPEAIIDWIKASVEDSRTAAQAANVDHSTGWVGGHAPYENSSVYVSVTPLDSQRVPMTSERFIARVREVESTVLRLSIVPRSLAIGTFMRIELCGEHAITVLATDDARLLRATNAGHGAAETLELAFACEKDGVGDSRALHGAIAARLCPVRHENAS